MIGRKTGVAVDRDAVRFALASVHHADTRSTVTGTDGNRLVRYDGFVFPWSDPAILLPASDVFGSPISREAKHVARGLSDNQLVFEVSRKQAETYSEAWTLRLAIQAEGRYPDVDSIISNLSNATNRV
jgi:hypothetical protein